MKNAQRRMNYKRLVKNATVSSVARRANFIEKAHWSTIVGHVASALAVLFLAAGFLITFFEYRASLFQQKIERSFKLIEQWEADGYRDILKKLALFVNDAEGRGTKELADKDISPTPGLLLNITQRSILDEFDLNNPGEIDEIVYFFNKLSLCAASELCDAKLILRYYEKTLFAFRSQIDLVVQERRKRVESYSMELDRFLKFS